MPYAVGLDDPDWTDARLDFKPVYPASPVSLSSYSDARL